jgi:dipeptidyl-peptidase-4
MPCRRITSRDVASVPQPGFNLAESIHFSPDDNLLTYLRSPNYSLMRQLYENDDIKEENFSKEEQLRREVCVCFS